MGEHFRLLLGLDLVHVPFNSAGLAVGATLAGHTPIAFTSLPPAVPQIKEGKLRALAVTSKMRSQALPDVPSMAEAGYPEVEGEGWFAFIVPAGTPKEITTRLHREIVKIIALPDAVPNHPGDRHDVPQLDMTSIVFASPAALRLRGRSQ